MDSKIQISLIQANIKSKLLVVVTMTICVDDTFSNPFNSYICENVVHNFINSMTEGSKYLKKNFKKELVMTEKDNSDFNVRKTGGGGVSLIPPVVFPKMYLVKSR